MNWTAYKIVLRLLTPLHVGAGSLGNVQRARPYIHSKALWGALTARLTRDNSSFGGDYKAVGDRVERELAFSYFYPATSDQIDLWPWCDPDEFAWRYLGSYTGTALDYSRNATEEGSLHETEFIAPTTRDGQPVHLVGYIFEQVGCSLPWRSELPRLQLGGERTYGWGRVALHSVTPATEDLFGRHRLTLDGERPGLHVEGGAPLLAHALAHGPQAVTARGPVVPLLGRETQTAAEHGKHLPEATVCWEPGSIVEAEIPIIFGNHGIWEKASP
jgi:hypothetical protein